MTSCFQPQLAPLPGTECSCDSMGRIYSNKTSKMIYDPRNPQVSSGLGRSEVLAREESSMNSTESSPVPVDSSSTLSISVEATVNHSSVMPSVLSTPAYMDQFLLGYLRDRTIDCTIQLNETTEALDRMMRSLPPVSEVSHPLLAHFINSYRRLVKEFQKVQTCVNQMSD